MTNKRPMMRWGRTIQMHAPLKGAGQDDAAAWTSLNRNHAVELARWLLQTEPELTRQVFAKIGSIELPPESADRNIPREIDSGRSNDARLSFNRGVIVDLRNGVFDTVSFRHRVRMCVTVCQGGQTSKVWFRSQCIGLYRDGEFIGSDQMTFAEMTKFFTESQTIGEESVDFLQDIYRGEIQRLFDGKGIAREVSLDKVKDFRFRLFDSDHAMVLDAGIKVSRGASLGAITGAIAESERDENPLVIVNRLAAAEAAGHQIIPDLDKSVEILGNMHGVRVIPYETVGGRSSILIEIPNVDAHGEGRSDYVGVAYSDNADHEESPALTTAAELLAKLVKYDPHLEQAVA